MKHQTDPKIIKWIRRSLQCGAFFTVGETVVGEVPESGKFYGGASRGMIPFEHTITAGDLEEAKISASKTSPVAEQNPLPDPAKQTTEQRVQTLSLIGAYMNDLACQYHADDLEAIWKPITEAGLKIFTAKRLLNQVCERLASKQVSAELQAEKGRGAAELFTRGQQILKGDK